MKHYVIDEKGRAVNVPHFPYLHTNEDGRGYELKLPASVCMRVRNADAEVVVGDTFIAYGGKYPEKYVVVSNFARPITWAMMERETRRLKRWGVPTIPRNTAWRYPLVQVAEA